MTIYTTEEWPCHGKQHYGWNEYRLEGDRVVQYKCYRQKTFDGHESEWSRRERIGISWAIDDPNMPEWLRRRLP